MKFLITITPEWISAIVAIVASFALLPSLIKWIKERKISKESKLIAANEKRREDVRPNFEIYNSLDDFEGKLIVLKNIGSKAFKMTLIAHGTTISPKLVLDRHDIQKDEVVRIFLGNDFHIFPHETNNVHIGYQDVDGRQYQQSYSKTGNKINLTSPILLHNK